MSKPLAPDGTKNLIGKKLKALRKCDNLSQEQLMQALQLEGFDNERGVIKRIEAGTRFVSDVELKLIADHFGVSYQYLLDDEFDERKEGKPDEDGK